MQKGRNIMNYIDEKFKEVSPISTVERIISILGQLGIELQEIWNDSGLDNCWSLVVAAKGLFPSSNGKGLTKELARASAYGEFMERLQSGLFLYKYQSIQRDPDTNLHSFAPDGKYMTLQEIIDNGEWMDYIIETYGSGLTREKLAQQCKMYAFGNEQILCLPFYSVFEDKYVYLPAGFVEQMYSANGCCVGNSREEAWVHALSEIMERKGSTSLLMSGKSARRIPDEVLNRFPTVVKIIEQIKASGNYDVAVFDTSINGAHPIVSTRIINKDNHTYVVDTGSDPVLEIAIHRTLTEMFQGRNIKTFTAKHSGAMLGSINDIPLAHNVLNLLETGNGMFTVDFFTEELGDHTPFTEFPDNSSKSNTELVHSLLDMYRKMGRPVYVRNYSFLGFNCYKFIIPGYSESRFLRLTEPFQEYLTADNASKVLRYPEKANPVELTILLGYHKQIQSIISKRENFRYLSGIPLWYPAMLPLTLAYAAYTLGRYKEAAAYLKNLRQSAAFGKDKMDYFACVIRYLDLKAAGCSEEKIRIVLRKFYDEKYADQLFDLLDKGSHPFEGQLLRCDCKSCDHCQFAEHCGYNSTKDIIAKAGAVYNRFTEGQARENFII